MRITVKAPATIANFGPGFDVFGMCIDTPFDFVEVEETNSCLIEISCKGTKDWNEGILKNTAGRAAAEVRKRFIKKYPEHKGVLSTVGFKIKLFKGYRAGSGLGSSAASAAGAAFAVHAILTNLTGGKMLDKRELAECAAEGEGAAGEVHPDNTTPALFGGFTVAFAPEMKYGAVEWAKKQYSEFKKALPKCVESGFKRFDPPKMYFSIVFPDIVLVTKDMRQLLKEADSRFDKKQTDRMISENVGFLKGVVKGFNAQSLDLICNNLKDNIVTPARKVKIGEYDAESDESDYDRMKTAAENAGAKAFILCGTGPCVAAVSGKKDEAIRILKAMRNACKTPILMDFVAEPNPDGVEVIAPLKFQPRSGAELLEKLK